MAHGIPSLLGSLSITFVLTERIVLALGSIDPPVPINPQEKLLERKQLPPPNVSLEMVVAAHMPPQWSPSPTRGTPCSPGPQGNHSLRDVQWNPETFWVGEPQSVPVEMAGCPWQADGEHHKSDQERQG